MLPFCSLVSGFSHVDKSVLTVDAINTSGQMEYSGEIMTQPWHSSVCIAYIVGIFGFIQCQWPGSQY